MQVTFLGLLTIMFIGLKLTNYIDWSWVWVLSPIWGTFVIVFFLYIFMILFTANLSIRKKRK
jgi:hypothetical protein